MSLLHFELIAATLSGLMLLVVLARVVSPVLHSAIRRMQTYVSSEKLTVTSLYTNESRYRAIVAKAPVIISAMDEKGVLIFSEGQGIQGLPSINKGRVGCSAFEVYKNCPQTIAGIRCALAGETVTVQHNLGSSTFDTQLIPAYNTRNQLIGVVTVSIDVTERVAMERALRYQAHYDVVTDLPNQTLLRERVEQELQRVERTPLALIVLDLDHFQEINDTFGHQQGDLILQQVGKRLSCALSPLTTVGRKGGDEFVVLLPGADEQEARTSIATICHVFDQPFLIQEFPMHIEASIGIALSSTPETDFATLLRQAEIAMYIAKRKHQTYVFYQPELDPYTSRRLSLLGELRDAITNGELTLYYQPQIDLQTGITHSSEALVRWNHPTYGFIPPDQFIPLAERTGLIQPLTFWVLEAAIKQCASWLQQGIQLSVSINLSANNLRETNLPATIAIFLERYTLPASYICVEVTESTVMADIGQAVEILNRISAMGIKIAVDDFGTGYSSLAYLKRLPVNELKIDRIFIKQMIADRIDATIVQSTVTMARDLGLKVVAEGIEDQETAQKLASYGCDCGQGYLWSRPVPSNELTQWLEKTKSAVMV